MNEIDIISKYLRKLTKNNISSKNLNDDVFFDSKNKLVIGYGAPAKATTALNFFGISNEIDYIIEDNKLKHNKFIPGVKIPIKAKQSMKDKDNILIVLAWNFFNDIKKNNSNISKDIINIKDLEFNK